MMSIHNLSNIVRFLVYAVIVGAPLFYLKKSVYPYTVSKTLFFQILVELLFIAWCFLMVADRRYRPRFTAASIGLAILMSAFLLTAFLGVDGVRSFWSMQDRMLGVFAFLHLAVFGLVVASTRDLFNEKNVFIASLSTACFITLLAIIQLSNPNLLLNEPIGGRPGATFGNPSFLAGYLVLHIIWAIYWILRSDKKLLEWWVFLGAETWLIVGLLITQTRGNLIGLMGGLIALIVLFAWQPPKEKGFFSRRMSYVGILAILFIGLAGFFFTRSSTIWEGVPGIERFRTLSLSSEDLGPRLVALRVGWKGFLERPIIGWGPENFNVVFNKHYEPSVLRLGYSETRFDKPHNYLLELLVVGGLVLFVSYFVFIALFLLIAWRSRDRLWAQVMTAALIAYIIGTAFIFETLGQALIFYLLFGLTSQRYLAERKETVGSHKKQEKREGGGEKTLIYGLAAVAAVPIFFVNIPTMRATYYQYLGFTTFRNSPALGMANFQRAIMIGSPYTWNLERDYAAAMSEAYFYNPERVNPMAVEEAIGRMARVASEHPLDAYNYYALVDMYNQTVDIDPKGHIEKAEAAGARALELSPNRQQVIFSLAKTRSLAGDPKGAVLMAKKGLDLDPLVPDGHFYYGLLSYAAGDSKQGYESLKQAIALGRKWKTVNEPLTVGNFFGDSGHLDEAITLYKQAKEMSPDHLEVRIKLGIAYFLTGQRDEARKEIREVMDRVDIKTVARYQDIRPILQNLGLE